MASRELGTLSVRCDLDGGLPSINSLVPCLL